MSLESRTAGEQLIRAISSENNFNNAVRLID
jgi:hypothetical protein